MRPPPTSIPSKGKLSDAVVLDAGGQAFQQGADLGDGDLVADPAGP